VATGDVGEVEERAAAPGGWWRRELRYQLELFALCGFAVAQPLLDVYGRNPEAFVFRGASRIQVVLFGVAIVVVPWLFVGGAAALTRVAGAAVRRWVQVGLLAALVALIAVHVVKQATGLRGAALLVVAIALGLLAASAYARWASVGLWARYASLGPVLFLVLFLVVSPTASLVFPSEAGSAALETTELPPHIVMLVFDELPTASIIGADGRIDGARFPNLAAFASRSTWYRNTSSVNGSTKFAVPALLSGRYPKDDLATTDNYPDNLFTMLGGSYDIDADEAMTALCPESLCADGPGGLLAMQDLTKDATEVWRQQVSSQDSDRQLAAGFVEETDVARGETSPARFETFLDELGEGEGRTFDFLHLLLPHQPWHFYPSGTQYDFPARDPGLDVFVSARWGDSPRPAELGRQRHLLQAQYVDHLLGRVVRRLERLGTYDDSLVVVAADHGVAFTAGQEPRPGIGSDQFPEETYEQVMWAPLIIKAPGQRAGEVSDANVETVDVLPTIAQMIGAPVPNDVQGVPTGQRGDDDPKTFFGSKTVGFERIALGPRTRVDAREGLTRMLADTQARFAPRRDPRWGFYAVGSDADLIGRPVRSFETLARAEIDVDVENRADFRGVDLDDDFVPGLVRGRVRGAGDETDEVRIAIAVNGTVGAVSPLFTDNSTAGHFAGLVPDFLFRDGPNDLRLFVVEGFGPSAALRPVPS
jgi:hypothetical protein